MIKRRAFLGAAAAGTGLLAARAAAAPILSATNFGLTLALAQRRNGWIEVDEGRSKPISRHCGPWSPLPASAR